MALRSLALRFRPSGNGLAPLQSARRGLRQFGSDVVPVTDEAVAAQVPKTSSYKAPELYDDKGQGFVTTMTFSNRPAWISPTRKHWLVELVDKIGVNSGTAMVVGICMCSSYLICSWSASINQDPKTHPNRKWQEATRSQKFGKMGIYWETRAIGNGDDDDDNGDDE